MADLEREHISVTEASGRGVARLVADAAHGAEVVVTRRGAPVAAVVSVERLAALDELRRDLRDLALVIGAVGRRRRPAGRARRRVPRVRATRARAVSSVVLTGSAVEDLRRVGPGRGAAGARSSSRRSSTSPPPARRCSTRRPGSGCSRPRAAGGASCYSVAGDVVTVHELWVDGARLDGEAYAEALDRMQGADQPDVVQLARILRRLGRITGTVPVPHGRRAHARSPTGSPTRSSSQAAVDPLTVAALDAAAAFDLWNTRPARRIE